MSLDSDYLVDIVSSARLILAYVEGVGREQFLQDTRLQDWSFVALRLSERPRAGCRRSPSRSPGDSLGLDDRNAQPDDSRLRRYRYGRRMEYLAGERPESADAHQAADIRGTAIVPRATIDRLIVNSPYEEPARH